MKLAAIALDYDGTIAVNDVMDASVRTAIAAARDAGIAVVLATGRRLGDLRRAAGDLTCFDVVVAENGAVVDFPLRGRHIVLGHPPPAEFVAELRRRGVTCEAGEALVEADATHFATLIEVIHALELPLVLTFNRGRVMALPQATGKSTGLKNALATLRISIHNTIAIGDAENDHDLLDACEVGVAVEWGSKTLRAAADDVVPGSGPAAVAEYIQRLAATKELPSAHMGRRKLLLGHRHDGTPVSVAVRGRPVLIAGEPGSGKSWIAGLMCEQSILQGYCLCVIDPEGDYSSLEALPGVIVLGGDDPPPNARELTRALRHPDVSVVIDLSRIEHREKVQYVEHVMDLLLLMRRQTGLPHRIVLDEAHYLLGRGPAWARDRAELHGQTLVTYRVSSLAGVVDVPQDAMVIVTKESDPAEIDTLRSLCRRTGTEVAASAFRDLLVNEAIMLPGADDSGGTGIRFQIDARLTAHVRHRTKYLDMPVSDRQAFVFTSDGRPVARAHTLKEFVGLLMALPGHVISAHLKRQDYSRWIESVFRDGILAARVRALEASVETETVREIVQDMDQTIRARYERPPSDLGCANTPVQTTSGSAQQKATA
jgi:hydroxymethylpyrimidine pyrophosphatase-like HAD family hydrolase